MTKTLKGTYQYHVTGDDFGCGATKVIVTLEDKLDAISKTDIVITETKQVTDFIPPKFPISVKTLERTVLNAYLCDAKGNKVEEASNMFLVELNLDPSEGSVLLFSMITQYNTYSKPYYMTIKASKTATLTSHQEAVTLEIAETATKVTTDADAFKHETYTAKDGITYKFVGYTPEVETDTLVVWLHGLGEGGVVDTDAYISVLANRVTALIQEPFQSIMGGAYVLAPQCPTYWMDNDGTGTSFSNGGIAADGTSYYTKSLVELIDMYKERCQAKKVLICGCSNGGYMTLLLALNYHDKYQGYVPICEAINDKYITDEQIQATVNDPLFFIYSKDDTTVDPTIYEEPTIARLKAAGAKNLCVSSTDHVVDLSGRFKGKDGLPYQYIGHWSWIYFDNNQSLDDETKQSVFDWMHDLVK